MWRIEALFIALLGLIWPIIVVESMSFELKSGYTKCISEDIKKNAMTVGKYTIVNPNKGYHPLPDAHKINVRVTSVVGNNYHNAAEVVAGNFAFTAYEDGDYMACFWILDHKPEFTLSIDFEWKSGLAAKDWPEVAKKGKVDEMELELHKMRDVVALIRDEMFDLRDREKQMHELNQSTSSKMATFSFLSLLVCLSVAGLQLWHLKSFFERKKLL